MRVLPPSSHACKVVNPRPAHRNAGVETRTQDGAEQIGPRLASSPPTDLALSRVEVSALRVSKFGLLDGKDARCGTVQCERNRGLVLLNGWQLELPFTPGLQPCKISRVVSPGAAWNGGKSTEITGQSPDHTVSSGCWC